MPVQRIKYALLWIPRSGLFYTSGEFVDGREDLVRWDRTIPIYVSRARAELAKERILKKRAKIYAKGDFVILGVKLREIE